MAKLSIPTTPHTLRFPNDLYDMLHITAEKDSRTFNGMSIYLMRLGLEVYKKYLENRDKNIENSSVASEDGKPA